MDQEQLQYIQVGNEYLAFPMSMSDNEIAAAIEADSQPQVSASQKLKDKQFEREMSSPFMMPQSTVEGDPDPRAIEEADPGLFLAGAIANIPESALNTAKGIGAFVGKGVEAMRGNTEAGMELVDSVRSLPGVIAQRYGGVENIKRTLHDDPVGMAAEVLPVAKGVVAGAPKVGPAAKAAVKHPVGEATIGAAGGYAVGGLPGAVAGAAGGGVMNRIIALAHKVLDRAPAAAPEAASPSTPSIKELGKIGKPAYENAVASDRMVKGMSTKPAPVVVAKPKPVDPTAGPMGENAMANDKLKRLMGTKPAEAPKPNSGAAQKPNNSAKSVTQKDVTPTLKTAPAVVAEKPTSVPATKSKRPSYTENDLKALKEKFGSTDIEDLRAQHGADVIDGYVIAERAKRHTAHYEKAKADAAARKK